MDMFIQINDGIPVNHPILKENFQQAFPDIDTGNLPDSFAKFVRVPVPPIGIWEAFEGTTYEWVDGVVQDVHNVRSLTDEEVAEKKHLLEAGLLEYISPMITEAQISLDTALPENKHYWQDYIDALRAFTVSYEISTPLPIKPLFTEEGNYVPPSSIGVTRV